MLYLVHCSLDFFISDNAPSEKNCTRLDGQVVLNLATLAMIMTLFLVEYWRENFVIDRFEINPDKIDNHLKRNVFSRGKYPQIRQQLRW